MKVGVYRSCRDGEEVLHVFIPGALIFTLKVRHGKIVLDHVSGAPIEIPTSWGWQEVLWPEPEGQVPWALDAFQELCQKYQLTAH